MSDTSLSQQHNNKVDNNDNIGNSINSNKIDNNKNIDNSCNGNKIDNNLYWEILFLTQPRCYLFNTWASNISAAFFDSMTWVVLKWQLRPWPKVWAIGHALLVASAGWWLSFTYKKDTTFCTTSEKVLPSMWSPFSSDLTLNCQNVFSITLITVLRIVHLANSDKKLVLRFLLWWKPILW